MRSRNYISVYFDDEVPLLEAVRMLREKKETIADVLSPFPVHGLDEALSMRRSRIPVGGFIFGALGAVLAFGFQAWVFTVSYPLIIGGKPFFSVPTFIPITFEVTILFAGLSMVAAFLIRSKLKPDIRFKPFDESVTDDRFVILVEASDEEGTLERVKSILSGINTLEIGEKEY
jgi:Protein of unknown function (DUF3341)